jgi:adenosylcobyric acid synthase
MFQGTGSDVGKSLIVAGLCRLFARQGLAVRPFKPQNMSNNAAVTADGGEIGRAQALQARACGVAPGVHMNPVLLKPETDLGAQVIVQGQRRATLKARDYAREKPRLLAAVCDSYARLAAEADLILVEGAGSPAEVNLRAGDIANMGFAEAVDLPVVLIADIDRGGVIASLLGTHAVLEVSERARIKGFLINKFRGDVSLFDEGLALIEAGSGWPSLGVVPHFAAAARLPAEDAVALSRPERPEAGAIKIAVPRLSRIANFDDLDPLRLEPEVAVEIVPPGRALPGDAALVILPGSKSTLGDLAFLRDQGWDIDLQAHLRRGGRVLGLCGGYQMLGRRLHDPDGIEGPAGSVDGLGLLDLETTMTGDKTLVEARGRHLASGTAVKGYEMHLGRSLGPDRVAGCYLHGLFAADAFRRAYLAELGARADDGLDFEAEIDATLDALAEHLATHLDGAALLRIAGAAG